MVNFLMLTEPRFETLADGEATDFMGLVRAAYEKDLLAEHQDRYFTHLVIIYRGVWYPAIMCV